MTNLIDAIKVTHTNITPDGSQQNIIINGEYWGQRHDNTKYLGSKFWYVVTSPSVLEYDGDMDEYITNQTVLGVYVGDDDYDLTVRQLYLMSNGHTAPF